MSERLIWSRTSPFGVAVATVRPNSFHAGGRMTSPAPKTRSARVQCEARLASSDMA
jgi:hypothetical protein